MLIRFLYPKKQKSKKGLIGVKILYVWLDMNVFSGCLRKVAKNTIVSAREMDFSGSKKYLLGPNKSL